MQLCMAKFYFSYLVVVFLKSHRLIGVVDGFAFFTSSKIHDERIHFSEGLIILRDSSFLFYALLFRSELLSHKVSAAILSTWSFYTAKPLLVAVLVT
jgi:hypothetical protein